MNGYDIFRRATTLLGCSGIDGTPAGETLLSRACDIINQIGSDFSGFTPISDLNTELEQPDSIIDAICYGTAMMLSLSEGDSKSRLFCELYNMKRAASRADSGCITDTLPVDDGGAV